MKLTVLSDLHIGVLRSAGTTPASQWNLRRWLLDEFSNLLHNERENDVMILGDLFDTNAIPLHDLLETYSIISQWLRLNPEPHLYLVAGNHDLSKTSTVLSSFQFLCKLLLTSWADRVNVIDGSPCNTKYGYVIPHLPNQDLFDAALAAVPACPVLFLHCNYDNNFAAQADQSLNLSKEQADKLLANGVGAIVMGHEHQDRRAKGIFIPGNQLPSSVSDCLGCEFKWLVEVGADGPRMETLYPVSDIFADYDWRDLPSKTHALFVRVIGNASADEATEVISTVAKFRAKSLDPFVITNSVKIEREDGINVSFAETLQSIKSFDVMMALKELLTEEEFNIIESLQP